MRSLIRLIGGASAVWSLLLPGTALGAYDRWPAPLTVRFDGPSEESKPEAQAKGFPIGPSLALQASVDAGYRLRAIDPDESEDDEPTGQSLFSVLDPLFRTGRADAGIAPLVHRQSVEFVPVRTLSLPNPFALVGNPLRWGGRLRAAYGSNFNDGSLLHGNLIIDSGLPLGIDTEFNYRTDPRRVLADREFWNGDFNVVYHLKQSQYVGFRIGVGANWLTDGDRTDVGFNTTYGFDIRLKKPFYVTTTIDYGWLGSKQTLHWHISGGLDLGRFELFIGYDFFEVGSRERKNVIAGAGMWY